MWALVCLAHVSLCRSLTEAVTERKPKRERRVVQDLICAMVVCIPQTRTKEISKGCNVLTRPMHERVSCLEFCRLSWRQWLQVRGDFTAGPLALK